MIDYNHSTTSNTPPHLHIPKDRLCPLQHLIPVPHQPVSVPLQKRSPPLACLVELALSYTCKRARDVWL